MANAIALFKKYIDLLDEVYKTGALTSDLDCDTSLVQAGANTDEIIIPKISMDGLGEYDRSKGYANGDVTLTNETVKFNYDRGRKFNVDAMDNQETAGLAFGKLSSEFIRTKVVPEMDAFRFATYANTAGVAKKTTALVGGEDVLNAILEASTQMDEAEVPQEDRILYIAPSMYNSIIALDTYKSKEALQVFTKIIKVPQTRFYTKITLKDGSSTTGEAVGGFVKSADAKDINFMIIQKDAVVQYPKHMVNKIIAPEANQTNDGWLFFYRAYGLVDVYENKVSGIYVHHKA